MRDEQPHASLYTVELTANGWPYAAEIWRETEDRWLLLSVVLEVGSCVTTLVLRQEFSTLLDALFEAERLIVHRTTVGR